MKKQEQRTIMFVSSNGIWGGSEVLWSETALKMLENGFKVVFAVKYNNHVIEKLKQKGGVYVNLSDFIPSSFFPRTLIRIKIKLRAEKSFFSNILSKVKPSIVIVSQGNNVDGGQLMEICRQQGVSFVSITQLVTEILWTFISDDTINKLRLSYAASKMNYFVSKDNLVLHEKMIGEKFPNSKVVKNCFNVPAHVNIKYPPLNNKKYQIALVGRLEVFHKGHDLLFQVIRQDKWQKRPVTFGLYGDGPHKYLLKRLVDQYKITNVIFYGHVSDAERIWDNNHLLILPSRMEGQSLALIEALWCYRTAVVSNLGGASELIDESSGFLVEIPSVEYLDAALEKAWSVKDMWEGMGKNAGDRIRKIFKEDPVDSLYKEILHLNW